MASLDQKNNSPNDHFWAEEIRLTSPVVQSCCWGSSQFHRTSATAWSRSMQCLCQWNCRRPYQKSVRCLHLFPFKWPMRALLVLILQAKLQKSWLLNHHLFCWVSKDWNWREVRDFRASLRLLPVVTRVSWLQTELVAANREILKGNFKLQRINISPLHWLTPPLPAEAFVQWSHRQQQQQLTWLAFPSHSPPCISHKWPPMGLLPPSGRLWQLWRHGWMAWAVCLSGAGTRSAATHEFVRHF